ncbi:aminotransferase class V-fold PLP-dependent enzyme [Muriicola sp. Z0-33]|uniref:aminotransferase class V-fold PLP-dependent enzyme n=1 Tax=Muriicola sp. Z0-33 TaxID=2816957 RepID=UPI002237AA87|nr:aminotransferase class V-fold PLP-dependent enzyme [Muriicola sp. Z0-33]MCW5516126.1 aminotransferase class V-fold PLP-dependent enzyme [Muriicola sp. Z0-33]
MQGVRKQFPALTHSIYANTAATGLLSQSLVEWRQEHDLDYLVGGSDAKMEQMEIISTTRATIGNFFSCPAPSIALVQNFSLGLNMLLEGLEKSSRILLVENDYPSVNWPFESRGFQITFAKLDQDLEQHIWEKIASEQIDVLALSLVQWLNGIKIELDFLKKLKENFPDLLIIADGTQFCGAYDFNFASSGIDILGASGYKWLLSGFGNGFMLFKEEIQNKLKLYTTGYNSSGINIEKKDSFRFAKHFEPGHLDTLNFGSLNFALEYLHQIGIHDIEAHNKLLMQKAKKEFASLGLLSNDVLNRDDHSTIFNIKVNQHTFSLLTEHNVVCSQRGEGIRLSFHLYNTPAEIDQISEILKKSM